MSRLGDIFRVRHEEVFSRGVKLQVVENKKMLMLKIDGATNSIIRKDSVYTGGYWDYFLPLTCIRARPRILLIGAGLGTTPYQVRALLGKKADMEIVDNDANVVKLARKYALGKAGYVIHVQDGRSFVAHAKKRYDLIILDAYWKGARIPKEFLTEAFMSDAANATKSDGILAINYAMGPAAMLGFGRFRRTLERFRNVYSVNTDSYGSMRIIICSKTLDKKTLLARISERFVGKPSLMKSYRDMREI